MTPDEVLNRFNEIYKDLIPDQGAVGHLPGAYILAAFVQNPTDKVLCDAANCLSASPKSGIWAQAFEIQNRDAVQKICVDTKVDQLISYCFAMAWGVQWSASGYDSFFKSVANPDVIRGHLEKLQDPSSLPKNPAFNCRQKAFQLFKETKPIPGLGISYFTKLFYFYRPEDTRGYVLDKWTASAVAKLPWPKDLNDLPPRPKSPWSPNSWRKPKDYEAYCMFVEYHAKQRGWSPSSVELAFFGSPNEGQPGKQWRNLLSRIKEKRDVLSDTED
jgi:hypothetical protein